MSRSILLLFALACFVCTCHQVSTMSISAEDDYESMDDPVPESSESESDESSESGDEGSEEPQPEDVTHESEEDKTSEDADADDEEAGEATAEDSEKWRRVIKREIDDYMQVYESKLFAESEEEDAFTADDPVNAFSSALSGYRADLMAQIEQGVLAEAKLTELSEWEDAAGESNSC